MHKKVVCVHTYFVWFGVEKKKKRKKSTKKIWQLSGIYISETNDVISFKLGMQGRVYGPNKIYKFNRNSPNRFRLKSARSWFM